MANYNEMFPSSLMKASDVGDIGDEMILTIDSVEHIKLKDSSGKDEIKWKMSFSDSDKEMVLNKTNAKTLIKLYGDESNNWHDKRITLVVAEVDFKGERVPALRVSLKKPEAAPTAKLEKEEDPF